MAETPKAKLFTMAKDLAQKEGAKRRTLNLNTLPAKLNTLRRRLIGTEGMAVDEKRMRLVDTAASNEKRKTLQDVSELVKDIMDSKHRVINDVQNRIEKTLDDDEKQGPDSHLDRDIKYICEELGIHVDADETWISQTWFTLFRLRQAFFLMCAFAILLALSAGWLMEVFFSFTADAHHNNAGWLLRCTWHLVFWALPFYMMILALLGDEMCDLILDSLDSPPLHSFQAMIVTAMHTKNRPLMKVGAVKTADQITRVVFDFIPLVAGVAALFFPPNGYPLYDQGSLTSAILSTVILVLTLFIEGYVQGSLMSAILCTVIFVVTDIKVAYQGRGEMNSIQSLRLRWFSEKIDQEKLNPYCLHDYFAHWAELHPGVQREDELTPAGYSRRPSADEGVADNSALLCARWFTLLCVAVWTLSVIFFSRLNASTDKWDPAILCVALVVTVAACSWCLHKHCPSIYGMPYVMILTFFVLVGVTLTTTSLQRAAITTTTDMKPIMSVLPGSVTDAERAAHLHPSWSGSVLGSSGSKSYTQPYPVCEMTWGSADAPLRALDLANLAWIVYDSAKDGNASMQKMLNESYPRRAVLVEVRPYEESPRWAHFYFPPEGNATRGTRVVAVKGISTPMDALAYTNLFETVYVLQSFNAALPVLNILPRLVIQWLLHEVHLDTGRHAEKKLWETLERKISNLTKTYPNDSFVITGHSLGGGLSQIAAAHLSLPALVWSSPGVEYSAKRFGIEVQALKRSVVSVMPDHDLIPRVDLQAGTLQLIECRDVLGNEDSAYKCHSLVKTACEIWRVCGDDRDFRQQCSKYVDQDELGVLYKKDDSTS